MNQPINRNDIEKVLQDIASELYPDTDPIQVVTSHNRKHGKYNTSTCQSIAKQLDLEAMDVCQSIVDLVNITELAVHFRFDAVEPGFIQIREIAKYRPMSPRMQMLMGAIGIVASDDYL